MTPTNTNQSSKVQLPEDVEKLIEQLRDETIDFVPKYFCNTCGSTDCVAKEHPELDGNPQEEWCNACGGTIIGRLQAGTNFLFDELKETLALQQQAREKEIEKMERDFEEEIENRDYNSDIADALSYKIASLLRPNQDAIEVIGEHSSHNDPWQNALDLEALSTQSESEEV